MAPAQLPASGVVRGPASQEGGGLHSQACGEELLGFAGLEVLYLGGEMGRQWMDRCIWHEGGVSGL